MAGAPNRWAYAAAAWAFAFAAISFYWAAGGTAGLDTLARDLEEDAREGGANLVALALVPGVLKAAVGVLALGLVERPRLPISRRANIRLVWLIAFGLTIYGVVLTAEKALMKAGAIDVPTGLGGDRLEWYLFFWDPLWLLGGVLFGFAARAAGSKGAGR